MAASLKAQRNRHSYSRIHDLHEHHELHEQHGVHEHDDPPPPPFKKLHFDSGDDEDDALSELASSEPGRGGGGRGSSSDIRKRIDFGSSSSEDESKDPVPLPEDVVLVVKAPSSRDDYDKESTSPPRTRSGKIYQQCGGKTSPPLDLRLNLLQADVKDKENDDLPELPSPRLSVPPPLHHDKRPVSRLSLLRHRHRSLSECLTDSDGTPRSKKMRRNNNDPAAASPPTNGIRSLNLYDGSPDAFHVSIGGMPRPRALFDPLDHLRRVSAPGNVGPGIGVGAGDAFVGRKRKRLANVNPFSSMPSVCCAGKGLGIASLVKGSEEKQLDAPQEAAMESEYRTPAVSRSDGGAKVSLCESPNSLLPGRRIRVTDINIQRFYEEFVEIDELACGVFGRVVLARHRLDGIVYAIKITKNQIHGQTHEERVAMNEVFAHSALIKHKHVVRYYNSWVENGRVYIQNEYCEGGSLGNKIKELRAEGKRFSEAELKKILHHVAKGLQYIHSKGLVHLDIKPENIFISLENTSASSSPSVIDDEEQNGDWAVVVDEAAAREPEGAERGSLSSPPQPQQSSSKLVPPFQAATTPSSPMSAAAAAATPTSSLKRRRFSGHDSTDSGNVSDNRHLDVAPMDDRLSYKIGDLGHVIAVEGDHNPEEGDSRYMAPELLLPELRRQLLYKSDVFSLGLSIFEAASLIELPKNTLDSPVYEYFKAGVIPVLEGYSKDFNKIVKAMVNPDPVVRPSVARLVTLGTSRNSNGAKSRSQLYKELRDTREKLKLLEKELENEKKLAEASSASPAFPTPPKEDASPTDVETASGHVLRSSKSSAATKGSTGATAAVASSSGRSKAATAVGTPTTSKRSRKRNLRNRTLVKSVLV